MLSAHGLALRRIARFARDRKYYRDKSTELNAQWFALCAMGQNFGPCDWDATPGTSIGAS
jgi:hypothetical protein